MIHLAIAIAFGIMIAFVLIKHAKQVFQFILVVIGTLLLVYFTTPEKKDDQSTSSAAAAECDWRCQADKAEHEAKEYEASRAESDQKTDKEDAAAKVDNILDKQLLKHETMVAAIANLAFVPEKCLMDHHRFTPVELLRFAASYGHKIDDSFMEEAKAHLEAEELNFKKLPRADQLSVAEGVCAMTKLYSYKVHQRQ